MQEFVQQGRPTIIFFQFMLFLQFNQFLFLRLRLRCGRNLQLPQFDKTLQGKNIKV